MIWLVGHKGMLGTEVAERLLARKIPHIASDLDVDITDPAALECFVAGRSLSWIINCSAYTAVDRAEDEISKAYQINEVGVANLARLARMKGARMLHISTDYVFDGAKQGAYLESDPPNPTGAYGASKLAGERAIGEILQDHYIVRTAWLFGSHGPNFVRTMLRLFQERDELNVVADQWGSPTLAGDLAEAVLRMVTDAAGPFGIYHFTNEGRTNWHGFATAIYLEARERDLVFKDLTILPIATDQYPTRAKRPANSYLSKDKVKRAFGISIRSWEEALGDYMSNLTLKG